jgi:O-antigen/teichoic acid export membrane protein
LSRLKELLSDTAIYGLSSVVARFLGYLLVPLYTSYFNPAEYGVVGLIFAGFVFLNVLFTFGMESAYIRFATEREGSRNVFRTLQTVLFLAGTALALLMLAGASWIQPLMSLQHHDADTLYFLLIGILWFDALSVVPYAELRLVRKSYTYAANKIINVSVNLTLNLWLVAGLGWGIEAVLWSNLAASVITALTLWIITRTQFRGRFDTGILRTALLFGLPYVPNGLGFAVNEVIDRFYLNSMSADAISRIYQVDYTPEDITGIYNACYKLAVFMLLTVQMFRMAWQPFFMKYAKDTDTRVLFGQVFDWFNLLAAVIFLSVGLFVTEIAGLSIPFTERATLIDSRYWAGLQVVPWIMMAYWFQGWFVNFSSGIFIKDQTSKLPAITLVGAAISIAGNAVLVGYLGMMGSAVAKVLTYSVMSLILLHYARKAMDVNYRVFRAMLMMAGTGLLVWLGTQSGIEIAGSVPVRFLLLICGLVFVLFAGRPQRSVGI